MRIRSQSVGDYQTSSAYSYDVNKTIPLGWVDSITVTDTDVFGVKAVLE